ASESIDPDSKFRRVFIPARIEDNPHLLGSDYIRMLQALPQAQRKALLLGRWDSVAGSVFELDHSVHVCDPFPVPTSWQRWRGCDDGYRAPFACLWFAHDRDGSDTVFVVGEIYQS